MAMTSAMDKFLITIPYTKAIPSFRVKNNFAVRVERAKLLRDQLPRQKKSGKHKKRNYINEIFADTQQNFPHNHSPLGILFFKER